MAATDRLTPDQLAAEVVDLLPEGPLVVALGGGADSAVAAWVAATYGDARGVFIQHNLDSSAALEQAAREITHRLGIDISAIEAPVGLGPSLESRARDIRWAAISTATEPGETIVTGHTQDDQAETMLMNLMRGSGSAGLAGMLRSRPGVARPLLGYSRADIRFIAEELELPFTDDPSNADLRFLRNRVRLELIPDLDRNYRPGVRSTLARSGSIAAADDEEIERLADAIPIIEEGSVVMIPSAPLATASRPIATRAVRRALRRLLEPYAGSEADVEAVLGVAHGGSVAATITGSLAVLREGPFVVIDPGPVSEPAPIAISVPGILQFGTHEVTFVETDASGISRRSVILLDPSAFGPGTVLRSTTEGDRIDIGAGSKSVRTVLSEAGIAVRLRSTWPVVANGGRIAAIVGIRVAPWARPTTRQAVAIGRKQDLS